MFSNLSSPHDAMRQEIHRLSDYELRQALDALRTLLYEGEPQLEDFEKLLLHKDELQRRLWLEEEV